MWVFRKIYNKIKERYFKRKYIAHLPEIIFDRRYREYAHPKFINGGVFSCVEDMLPYLVMHKLVYEFTIMDEYYCHNAFYKVLMDAYNYGNAFEVPPECESDYSAQELNILKKLIVIGEKDRKEFSDTRGEPHVIWNKESGMFEVDHSNNTKEID